MASEKPINSLVIDAGPIIKNSPPVSTLIAQSETLFTIPAVIAEIRDEVTRARVETTLLPFLTQRNPHPDTVKIVQDFARRTGDLAVLSKTDIQLIALARDLECERNGGDWRLRNAPGQKRTNGPPPAKPVPEPASSEDQPPQNGGIPSATAGDDARAQATTTASEESGDFTEAVTSALAETQISDEAKPDVNTSASAGVEPPVATTAEEIPSSTETSPQAPAPENATPTPDGSSAAAADAVPRSEEETSVTASATESDSDNDGWITPSNIKKKQTKDLLSSAETTDATKTMQAAIMTTDFAMQNVILQMNLNLVSPTLQRVKHLKTFVLRCHACFLTTKEMGKQFCPRCGKPTLTRVTCTTTASGEFKLHLKKNMQWNNRGERYSVPKPAVKSASGRITAGGGKDGWGADLILAEDQKEYTRAVTLEKRQKQRDLMDEDYLPSILTGERHRTGGRPKVGAGRNVNARKRK
ncbi:Nin one binding (NOB1) Zn-ribbon-like protein [Macrophomina phaseolina MS6]|uniref:20S-pre-rRNA D-site endonuclease NOB1 n=1 Tax=Macrophomina phaseolina (strain MS6) TaxID=1126212 RepID=K2S1L7_MACPH|nr:Nin one binding (NOB1) Zn-ribbon-like protein [Macrophomina phaseolina MS6]